LNFKRDPNYPEELVLDQTHLDILKKEIFDDESIRWFMFNARFDMAFLAKRGIRCAGRVHDCKSIYRIINNEAFIKFDLENCARSIKLEKSQAVENFIDEHDLWDWMEIPGKKAKKKWKHYDMVPLDIISAYAEKDAEITYKLGLWQLNELQKLEAKALNLKEPSYRPIVANEISLTKTVFEMEQRGVQLDIPYCKKAIEFFSSKVELIVNEFKTLTGFDFKDSEKVFLKVFTDEQIHYGEPSEKTGKVTACFDNEVLQTYKNPAAKVVLDYREAKSTLDFFQGFLFYADDAGVLHASFSPDGTVTGRFSSQSPNLQNLTQDTDESLKEMFVIRRAIIPRPGFFFAMFDWDQVEYRLVIDHIESKNLIEKILGGLDVHQATAQLAEISRGDAKNVNFGTLYGQGIPALAEKVKCTRDKAEALQTAIFKASPELKPFIFKLKNHAEKAGYIVNWFGRRCYFPDRRFAYKAINSWSQGGCADVIKIAMNKVHAYLADKQSKMVLSIHDDLTFEIHETEVYVLPEIKKIMETAYPYKLLPLTVSVEYSYTNLADKIEGMPQ
jgi:DNA polymerase-1